MIYKRLSNCVIPTNTNGPVVITKDSKAFFTELTDQNITGTILNPEIGCVLANKMEGLQPGQIRNERCGGCGCGIKISVVSPE